MNAPQSNPKHKSWTSTMIVTVALAVLGLAVIAAACLEMSHPLATTILSIR